MTDMITKALALTIFALTCAVLMIDTTGNAVAHSETAAAVAGTRCLVTAIDRAGHPIRTCL